MGYITVGSFRLDTLHGANTTWNGKIRDGYVGSFAKYTFMPKFYYMSLRLWLSVNILRSISVLEYSGSIFILFIVAPYASMYVKDGSTVDTILVNGS